MGGQVAARRGELPKCVKLAARAPSVGIHRPVTQDNDDDCWLVRLTWGRKAPRIILPPGINTGKAKHMKPSYGMALLLASISLAACGGGSGGTTDSRRSVATMHVVWPERGRQIPQSANSLGVTITKGVTTVGYALIARPADGVNETSTDFTDLPAGNLYVTVVAYPNADGTGTAQAAGGGSMTTALDAPGTITVSLVSTVTTLTIAPDAVRIAKGLTTAVHASAKDSDNNVVLLSANGRDETVTWTTGTPAVATVTGTTATGTLNGLTAGTSQIGASFVSSDTGTTIVATPFTFTVAATSGHVIIK